MATYEDMIAAAQIELAVMQNVLDPLGETWCGERARVMLLAAGLSQTGLTPTDQPDRAGFWAISAATARQVLTEKFTVGTGYLEQRNILPDLSQTPEGDAALLAAMGNSQIVDTIIARGMLPAQHELPVLNRPDDALVLFTEAWGDDLRPIEDWPATYQAALDAVRFS